MNRREFSRLFTALPLAFQMAVGNAAAGPNGVVHEDRRLLEQQLAERKKEAIAAIEAIHSINPNSQIRVLATETPVATPQKSAKSPSAAIIDSQLAPTAVIDEVGLNTLMQHSNRAAFYQPHMLKNMPPEAHLIRGGLPGFVSHFDGRSFGAVKVVPTDPDKPLRLVFSTPVANFALNSSPQKRTKVDFIALYSSALGLQLDNLDVKRIFLRDIQDISFKNLRLENKEAIGTSERSDFWLNGNAYNINLDGAYIQQSFIAYDSIIAYASMCNMTIGSLGGEDAYFNNVNMTGTTINGLTKGWGREKEPPAFENAVLFGVKMQNNFTPDEFEQFQKPEEDVVVRNSFTFGMKGNARFLESLKEKTNTSPQQLTGNKTTVDEALEWSRRYNAFNGPGSDNRRGPDLNSTIMAMQELAYNTKLQADLNIPPAKIREAQIESERLKTEFPDYHAAAVDLSLPSVSVASTSVPSAQTFGM